MLLSKEALRRFFYNQQITPAAVLVLLVYALLSGFLFWSFLSEPHALEFRPLLLVYTLGTQFWFLLFGFRQLRNITLYLTWCCWGLAHLLAYFALNHTSGYEGPLRNTLVLLLLFQGLRYLSLRLRQVDFIPAVGKPPWYVDGRRATGVDFLLTHLYMGIILLLFLLSLL
ncbi:hypothetical protein F0P96_07010 [Hymenobacter busanensis]|uniref:Uncharacterized protein n=1 Tax=Hymenobacter busanensis TaxID=2607656 RepID=A0A7L5A0E5_9BACT|nr:hypothetical protein [Hymenobacter busanensis]KAA9338573.1 hypothetical protein F0P96_07010 [Hymenobacter busanensis]QHJ08998.1 hypothetical protein GUY19_17590 [Hymenobacter busanensis]